MAKADSEFAFHSTQKAMLKELAEEAASRASRNQRAGLGLSLLSLGLLYFGLNAVPYTAFGLLLAVWAIKDAYAADEELRILQKRMA